MTLKGTIQEVPFSVDDDLVVTCPMDTFRDLIAGIIEEGFSPADGYLPQALEHKIRQFYGDMLVVTEILPLPSEYPPDAHF